MISNPAEFRKVFWTASKSVVFNLCKYLQLKFENGCKSLTQRRHLIKLLVSWLSVFNLLFIPIFATSKNQCKHFSKNYSTVKNRLSKHSRKMNLIQDSLCCTAVECLAPWATDHNQSTRKVSKFVMGSFKHWIRI